MSDLPVVVAVEPDDCRERASRWRTPRSHGRRWSGWPRSSAERRSTLAELTADRRVAVVGAGAAGESALEVVAETGGIEAFALVGAPLSSEAVAARGGVARAAAARRRRSRRSRRSAAAPSTPTWPRPIDASDLLVGAVDGDGGRTEPPTGSPTGSDRTTQRRRGHPDVERRLGAPRHAVAPDDVRSRSPGVVLLHSGRSDRAVFSRLERLLAERGFAVLNLDWRGRGPEHEPRDLHGAQRRRAGRRVARRRCRVRPPRRAARRRSGSARRGRRDPRRRARRTGRGRRFPGARPRRPHRLPARRRRPRPRTSRIRASTCSTSRAPPTASRRRRCAPSTKRHRAGTRRFVEYAGGAIGYQLFELDPGLEPAIVDWLAEVLRP